MKALRLETWQSQVVVRDVDVPDPGQVLIRIGLDEAATAYHSLASGAVDGRAVVVPTKEYRP
jgi:hypothetical protein